MSSLAKAILSCEHLETWELKVLRTYALELMIHRLERKEVARNWYSKRKALDNRGGQDGPVRQNNSVRHNPIKDRKVTGSNQSQQRPASLVKPVSPVGQVKPAQSGTEVKLQIQTVKPSSAVMQFQNAYPAPQPKVVEGAFGPIGSWADMAEAGNPEESGTDSEGSSESGFQTVSRKRGRKPKQPKAASDSKSTVTVDHSTPRELNSEEKRILSSVGVSNKLKKKIKYRASRGLPTDDVVQKSAGSQADFDSLMAAGRRLLAEDRANGKHPSYPGAPLPETGRSGLVTRPSMLQKNIFAVVADRRRLSAANPQNPWAKPMKAEAQRIADRAAKPPLSK